MSAAFLITKDLPERVEWWWYETAEEGDIALIEGLRSVVHGSHIVFYQPQPYGVLIVRVLHGRQDVRTHLGGGEEP